MPIYKLSTDAILETFEEGGLVLILSNRQLVELNPSAVNIIGFLDGQRSPEQVAVEIANTYENGHDYPIRQIVLDVLELCRELNQIGILELQPDY